MNINELLNSRREALYGTSDESDFVLENMGDITGEIDLDDIEIDEELLLEALEILDDDCFDDEDLFDENDLKDIMIESMDMEDPDEYINNALKEYSDESMALVGEMYIDELIVEEAVSMCEDYDELENIEEAFKENVKSKAGKAKATIANLAKKFATWIQGLIGSLSTLFVSGEKLVSKYKGKIIAEYNSRGQRIKVKTYKYSHKPEQLKSVLNGILDSNNIGSDMKEAKKSEETMKSIKENAVKCIRSDEKKEYRVSELGINNILELAGDKKKIIKALQDVNKEMQKMFKKGIDTIKEDQGKSESELNKDQAKNAINAVKYASKCSTAAVNAYISEVRSANRACTAIVKRLLNTKKAPNTPDAKGLGGPTE